MSNALTVKDDKSLALGQELRNLCVGSGTGRSREAIAFSLVCYLRDHQIGPIFEQHLFQVTGLTVEELVERPGADPRIRARLEEGDPLVRARYVMQLLHRFYLYGHEDMLWRDSHVICTVVLGGGDHSLQHGADELRAILKASPLLSQLLNPQLMLGQQVLESPADETDTSQYFQFLDQPWYLRLFRFVIGG